MFIQSNRGGDSGRSLLTGGRCSEVAVSTGTGLTVCDFLKKKQFDNPIKLFHSKIVFDFILNILAATQGKIVDIHTVVSG